MAWLCHGNKKEKPRQLRYFCWYEVRNTRGDPAIFVKSGEPGQVRSEESRSQSVSQPLVRTEGPRAYFKLEVCREKIIPPPPP